MWTTNAHIYVIDWISTYPETCLRNMASCPSCLKVAHRNNNLNLYAIFIYSKDSLHIVNTFRNKEATESNTKTTAVHHAIPKVIHRELPWSDDLKDYNP